MMLRGQKYIYTIILSKYFIIHLTCPGFIKFNRKGQNSKLLKKSHRHDPGTSLRKLSSVVCEGKVILQVFTVMVYSSRVGVFSLCSI